ncbi:hypothetical protein [Caulobacter soli]|uniref:hypothetical protein n=1 Tax=Caulobacter soli TaxID=2708539 RepID=UPI0013EA5ABE|nr:hypothetical protein [Caulobacter soli]
MKKFGLIVALSALLPVSALVGASTAAAESALEKVLIGKLLYDADGKKLAPIYKIDPSGSPQILLDGKAITVPMSSLTEVDGKFTTKLTKRDLMTS